MFASYRTKIKFLIYFLNKLNSRRQFNTIYTTFERIIEGPRMYTQPHCHLFWKVREIQVCLLDSEIIRVIFLKAIHKDI